jgi:hypothetical protein
MFFQIRLNSSGTIIVVGGGGGVIILVVFLYHRFSSPWYFSSLVGDEPHHSGFQSQIVALSL